jgi:hypothetical protein
MMSIHASDRSGVPFDPTGDPMTEARHASAHSGRGVKDIGFPSASAPYVVGAIAGEERRRRYGARIAAGQTWLAYDSLELLPHLLTGVPVEAVVVDLVRWRPVEASPVLRELRRGWPSLRVVGIYEPSADALPELADLAQSDRRLAFTCDADERFELLLRPASEAAAVEAPTACQLLLEHLLPLATDGLRRVLIDLALAPSRRRSIPALAAAQGWSEDGLERRFGDAGLMAPAAVRRLAVVAEGVWQVATPQRSAEEVARALGLGTADSLGRVIKDVFGLGFKSARLIGAEGARRALAWVGLLTLRSLAPFGGMPSLASVRLAVTGGVHLAEDRGALVVTGPGMGEVARLEGPAREVWELVAAGAPLGEVVNRMSIPAEGGAGRLAREVAPTLRWLLRRRLVVPLRAGSDTSPPSAV